MREYGADAQDADPAPSGQRLEVVSLGAREHPVAVHESHAAQVGAPPHRRHLGTIPLFVGIAAKSFSPNGIGAVEDLREDAPFGHDQRHA